MVVIETKIFALKKYILEDFKLASPYFSFSIF